MLQLPEVVEFLGLDKQPDVSGEDMDVSEEDDPDSVNRSGKCRDPLPFTFEAKSVQLKT